MRVLMSASGPSVKLWAMGGARNAFEHQTEEMHSVYSSQRTCRQANLIGNWYEGEAAQKLYAVNTHVDNVWQSGSETNE